MLELNNLTFLCFSHNWVSQQIIVIDWCANKFFYFGWFATLHYVKWSRSGAETADASLLLNPNENEKDSGYCSTHNEKNINVETKKTG